VKHDTLSTGQVATLHHLAQNLFGWASTGPKTWRRIDPRTMSSDDHLVFSLRDLREIGQWHPRSASRQQQTATKPQPRLIPRPCLRKFVCRVPCRVARKKERKDRDPGSTGLQLPVKFVDAETSSTRRQVNGSGSSLTRLASADRVCQGPGSGGLRMHARARFP
jgi:hypothetical protein